MAVSDAQFQSLQHRVAATENAVNDIFTAMQRLITLGQVQQLLTLTQTELASLESTVTALEARVTAIEEEPFN